MLVTNDELNLVYYSDRLAQPLGPLQKVIPIASDIRGFPCNTRASLYNSLVALLPQKILDCIDSNRLPAPPITDPDEPLHIDSLGVLRIAAFIQNDMGISIEDEELVAENFETLRTLGDLIASHSKVAEQTSDQLQN